MDLLKKEIGITSIICMALLAIMALSQGAYAGAECASLGGACDSSDGGWDPMAKLDEMGTGNYDQSQASQQKWPQKSREVRWNMTSGSSKSQEEEVVKTNQEKPIAMADVQKSPNRLNEIMIEIDEISDSDVILDVSENATERISGSLAIPYPEFMQDNSPKSVSEIAEILGDAGISQNDSLVIFGECLPCGGGPSVSAYVYWMMKSMGHKKVRILDGYLKDWKEKGLPVSSDATIKPAREYTPKFTDQFIASYDYVKSGRPQVVDARTIQEYGSGSIPNAISIPYDSILDGDKIKNVNELEKRLSILDQERPVVAFTNTGFKGSVMWLALEIMGFDAKLYSYENWIANKTQEEKSGDIERGRA